MIVIPASVAMTVVWVAFGPLMRWRFGEDVGPWAYAGPALASPFVVLMWVAALAMVA